MTGLRKSFLLCFLMVIVGGQGHGDYYLFLRGPVDENDPVKLKEFLDKERVKDDEKFRLNVNSLVEKDKSLLWYAVDRERRKIVNYLITKGANVNFVGPGGMTPFHVAISKGDTLIAEKLIVYKANLDAEDDNGHAPLHTAVLNNDIQMVNVIVVAYKQAESIEIKLPNLNVKDAFLRTPLHMAVEKGSYMIAEALIDAKADLNIKDDKGMTPFQLAMKTKQWNMVVIFVENAKDKDKLFFAEEALKDLLTEVYHFFITHLDKIEELHKVTLMNVVYRWWWTMKEEKEKLIEKNKEQIKKYKETLDKIIKNLEDVLTKEEIEKKDLRAMVTKVNDFVQGDKQKFCSKLFDRSEVIGKTFKEFFIDPVMKLKEPQE